MPRRPDQPITSHGYTGYSYGCRCEVCKKANTEHQREYRAGFACCGTHPGCACLIDPESATRRATRRDAGNDGSGRAVRARAVRRHTGRNRPQSGNHAPSQVNAPSALSGDVTNRVANRVTESARDHLWATEVAPLLGIVPARDDGFIGTVTIDPPYTYAEYLSLLEDAREYYGDEFPLQWEYEKNVGVYVWNTGAEREESSPDTSGFAGIATMAVMPAQTRTENREPQPASKPQALRKTYPLAKPRIVANYAAPSLPVAGNRTVNTYKFRYEINYSSRGMCEVKTEWDDTNCTRYVGWNTSEWQYTVNGRPACQTHYDTIRAAYPERCQYRDISGTWKKAPQS